jgi:hypothetical protein
LHHLCHVLAQEIGQCECIVRQKGAGGYRSFAVSPHRYNGPLYSWLNVLLGWICGVQASTCQYDLGGNIASRPASHCIHSTGLIPVSWPGMKSMQDIVRIFLTAFVCRSFEVIPILCWGPKGGPSLVTRHSTRSSATMYVAYYVRD